jgi:hypothetical protein
MGANIGPKGWTKHVGCKSDQLGRMDAKTSRIAVAPAAVDLEGASDGPAQFLQHLLKRSIATLSFGVVSTKIREHPDASHALGLLRARPKRPGGCRAAEKRDEIAACRLFELYPVPCQPAPDCRIYNWGGSASGYAQDHVHA